MLHLDIRLYNGAIHGKGLIASKFIPQGQVVWRLDKNEKRLTLKELNKLPEKRRRLAYQYKDKYIIVSDNSEYMNHSSNPNTWWIDDDTLTALRDIRKGEEVTYDYATAEVSEDFRSSWKCHCGAKNCRKIITGGNCLDKGFQEKYKDHLSSWVLEFIEKNKSQ